MHRRTSIALASIVLSLLLAVACGKPMSPEEKVADQRSQYTATLNGFVVHSVPVEEAQGDAMTDEAAGEMTEPATGEAMDETDQMTEEAAPAPVRQDAILDILVSTTSREPLSHLTVDIDQVDANQNPKGHWLAYLDTSDVLRGPGTQISYTIENVDYAEGDGFNVEVRNPVPAEDRGQYREFEESSSAE